jgi:hypothetical protein
MSRRIPDIIQNTTRSAYSNPPFPLDGKKYYWRIKLWDSSDNASSYTNGCDYFIR